MVRILLPSTLLLVMPGLVVSQTKLPMAESVDWPSLRKHIQMLVKDLEKQKAPLPHEIAAPLRHLLDREPADKVAAARAVQKLLDPLCLLAVSINPESRVKALRGPTRATLSSGQPRVVLVKVHNEAGVTPALGVSGPGVRMPGKTDPSRWLQAELLTAPFGARLTGRRLEYRLLKLTTRATGKREATFHLDAGQGTQDLGFRAEVPLLFTIRSADTPAR